MFPLSSIYTIQLGKWRLAKKREIEMIDITAKSGEQAFAPDFATVMRYKQGLVSETEYTELYTIRMRASLRTYPEVWASLLTKGAIAFACYCPADCYCHRLLFVTMYQKYAHSKGFTVVYRGELRDTSVS